MLIEYGTGTPAADAFIDMLNPKTIMEIPPTTTNILPPIPAGFISAAISTCLLHVLQGPDLHWLTTYAASPTEG